MGRWQLQDAKQQFSRVVDRARSEGPQLVTRHGKEVAVVLGIEEYRRLRTDEGAFKRFLLEPPHVDDLEIERATAPAPAVDLAPDA
jgi:prevent-host-death family protein